MLFVSRVILISPSNPGTPQNACILRGAPFGLSSPVASQHALGLRGGVTFAAYLSHGCSFSPSEYSFGGDPVGLHSSHLAGLTLHLYKIVFLALT